MQKSKANKLFGLHQMTIENGRKKLNREYLIMRIALGDTTAEANNITLTEKDKEAIEWYKRESEKAKKEGKFIVFYAPDDE